MKRPYKKNKGFTLIELLVAMAISSIAMAAIYVLYNSQIRSHTVREQSVDMQQNARAALYFMEREIRLAGLDPSETDDFGITDVRKRDNDYNLSLTGNPSLSFTSDFDGDENIDSNETISYSVYDYPVGTPDGITDLARNNGGGRQLIAQNIVAIGFAYAFDRDNDGLADRDGGEIIWAVDSDNDNLLDQSLDTNKDGNIDLNDTAGGAALGYNVDLDEIKAVRIWVLARTRNNIRGYTEGRTFVVGDRRISPADNHRHTLFSTTVKCRNL